MSMVLNVHYFSLSKILIKYIVINLKIRLVGFIISLFILTFKILVQRSPHSNNSFEFTRWYVGIR